MAPAQVRCAASALDSLLPYQIVPITLASCCVLDGPVWMILLYLWYAYLITVRLFKD